MRFTLVVAATLLSALSNATAGGGVALADASLCWEDNVRINGPTADDCSPRSTTRGCECRMAWYTESGEYVSDYCTSIPGVNTPFCETRDPDCQIGGWGYCSSCQAGTFAAPSAAFCAAACEDAANCKFWMYRGMDKVCKLKSGKTGVDSDLRPDKGFVSGQTSREECTRCYATDVSYGGQALKQGNGIASLAECDAQCEAYEGCEYWVWNKETEQCRLMGAINAQNRVIKENVVTAKRGCSVPAN